MTKLRLVAAVGLFLAFPATARAQDGGLMEWIEKLSGPGPYTRGWTVDFRLACFTPNADDRKADRSTAIPSSIWMFSRVDPRKDATMAEKFPCFSNAQPVKSYLQAHFGRAESKDTPVFPDTPSDTRFVNTTAVDLFFMLRLHPAVSIGAGFGWMWFTGQGFSVVQSPTATPIAFAISPLVMAWPHERWARVPVMKFDEVYIYRSLDASDFASKSSYVSHGEILRRYSVVFDVGAYFGVR
jgi:hypothetical protein